MLVQTMRIFTEMVTYTCYKLRWLNYELGTPSSHIATVATEYSIHTFNIRVIYIWMTWKVWHQYKAKNATMHTAYNTMTQNQYEYFLQDKSTSNLFNA